MGSKFFVHPNQKLLVLNNIFLTCLEKGMPTSIVVSNQDDYLSILAFLGTRTIFVATAPSNSIGFNITTIDEFHFDSSLRSLVFFNCSPDELQPNQRLLIKESGIFTARFDFEKSEINSDPTKKNPIDLKNLPQLLHNEKISELFKQSFDIAEQEILISCPWMNFAVVNETLLSKIEGALSRGVQVKIRYGIGAGTDERSKKSDDVAAYLKEKFSCYSNRLDVIKTNSHVKVLICDDKFSLFGSYNFLSNSTNFASGDAQDESAHLFTDLKTIAVHRYNFFEE